MLGRADERERVLRRRVEPTAWAVLADDDADDAVAETWS